MIVNFNSGDLLKYCLESLRKQTYSNFEIIVIDNASKDRSFKNINHDELKDLSVRFFFNDTNLGLAVGMNQAAKLAEGKWLATLSCNTMVSTNWLAEMAQATKKYPDTWMFSSTHIRKTVKKKYRLHSCGQSYSLMGAPYYNAYSKLFKKSKVPASGEVFAPSINAALFNRDAYFRADGLDNRFFYGCEDIDLAFRLRFMGSNCIHIKEAGAYYLEHNSSKNKKSKKLLEPDFVLKHKTRNTIWVLMKNIPKPMMYYMLPLHVLYLCGVLIKAYRVNKHKTVIAAIKEALEKKEEVLKTRRYIQSSRMIDNKQLSGSFTRSPFKFWFNNHDIRSITENKDFKEDEDENQYYESRYDAQDHVQDEEK